jgi:hypothetical protein
METQTIELAELFRQLAEPFPASAIDWRVGSTTKDKTKGIALAYLQARPVMDRLDQVLGPENWQDTYEPIMGNAGPVGFKCSLSLRIKGEWITKTDAADTSDIEAIKGGVSDALKRAAVKWGIGRYLYDLPTIWVALEPRGNSWVIKETPTLPGWALPTNRTKTTPTPMITIPEKGSDPEIESPARETEGTEPTNNSTPTMTIEDACKVKNSKGEYYYLLSPETLSNMSIGIGKALRTETDPDFIAEYQTKLKAIGILLKAKANKEIA